MLMLLSRALALCSVLWRSAPGVSARALRLTAYRACPAVATSDHAPVCASFTLTLPE
jgi:hypothetical protein